MAKLPPLIIEAADPMVENKVDPFADVPDEEEIERQVEDTAQEAADARDAGAAIAHIHGLSTKEKGGNYPTPVIDPTAEMLRRIALKTNVIHCYARSYIAMKDRTEIVKKSGAGKPGVGAMSIN